MGDWKGEFAKVKSALATKEATDNRPRVISQPEHISDGGVDDWKAGVKQLPSDARVQPWRLVRETPIHPSQQPKKKREDKVSKPGQRKKRRDRRDGHPDASFIHQTYGGETRKASQASPAQRTPSIRIPSVAELPKVAIAKQSDYKEPEGWVIGGVSTQPSESSAGRALSVRMGIDFGTSYTKVALRLRDKVLFVRWHGVHGGRESTFLPGELSWFADGGTRIGRAPGATAVVGALKSPFLTTDAVPETAYLPATVFLAWVMRYARAWLYKYHPELVRGRTLAWSINIGAATDPWSQLPIVSAYKRVVSSAWQLSQVMGEINSTDARHLLKSGHTIDGLDDVRVIPELVAQILGYVKSPQRSDGLYLLVDIGAGTLDVSAFIIYENRKEEALRYPILEGLIAPLGTHVLMGARLAGSAAVEWEDIGEIPSAEQMAASGPMDAAFITAVDQEVERSASEKIAAVLQKTRQKRYPLAPEWKKGLRVFIAGGGSHCRVYRDSVRKAFERLGVRPIPTEFPEPDGLEQLHGAEFHRLSVAYGLTYDADGVGAIVRPQDIEDIVPSTNTRERPDRDDLYAK